MMLRVLLTCEDFLPQVGGAEIYVARFAEELRRRGHTVTVFTNTVERLPGESGIVRLPWRFSPLTLWRNTAALWCLVGSHDVIHCTYSFRIAAICAVFAHLRGRPMVLTQQGRGIVPEVRPLWYHALLVRLCQEISMRCAQHITATSVEIADLTAAFVPRDKVTVISNGYDPRAFCPSAPLPVPPEFASLPEGTRRLLTVRRLVPKNGIHILVQALAIVRDSDPHFRYVAVGDGRARSAIEALIADLRLGDHVRLAGARTNEEVAAYVRHSDLMIFPSSAEAQSIACIEAMGAGVPVIASRVGGLIDLLGEQSEYGLLVPLYDTDGHSSYDAPWTLPRERLERLADAILAFFRDPTPFRARAERARRRAERGYSWSAVTDRYLAIYRKLPGFSGL